MSEETLIGISDHRVRAALAAAESADATAGEKVEMLMEIAMGLQQKPKSSQDLFHAVSLYEKAITLCPSDEPLLQARVQAHARHRSQRMSQDFRKSL